MSDARPPKSRPANLIADVESFGEARNNCAGREKRWLEENRTAINAYNRRISQHGLLTDEIGL